MEVPRRGIASDTLGRVSVTMLWNTVSDRRMVTPAKSDNLRECNNDPCMMKDCIYNDDGIVVRYN